MLRLNRLIIVIIAITLISCSEEIVNPIDEDSSLKQSVTREWGYRNSFVQCFYSDGSFIDSLFSDDPMDSNKIKLFYVKNGKYRIDDKILTYYDVNYEVKFDTNRIGAGFSGISMPEEIEFNNNYLIIKAVDIFTRVTGDVGIFGRWKTEKDVANYIAGATTNNFYGIKIIDYNFLKDTNVVIYSWEYSENVPWNNGADTLNYAYSFPFMNLPYNTQIQFPNINVRFNGNKMFWYYTNEIWSMPKLK